MYIYLPELKARPGKAVDYRFEENLYERFDDFSQGETLSLQLSASCSGDKVLVSGSFEASTTAVCSRCLEPFNHIFKTEFTEAFTVTKGYGPEETKDALAFETANSLTVAGDYLYLDEYIRQLVILAQEYRPLCSPDCKGICAGCGADLNNSLCRCNKGDYHVDVRLLKLKELKSGS